MGVVLDTSVLIAAEKGQLDLRALRIPSSFWVIPVVYQSDRLASTMRARLISFLILGYSFCNVLQAQSAVSSKIFQTGRNSDGKPIVTIRLQASGDSEDVLTNEVQNGTAGHQQVQIGTGGQQLS